MHKTIFSICVLVLVIFLSVFPICAEEPLDIDLVFDESFAGENEGKAAITVSNRTENNVIENVELTLELPEGVSARETTILVEELLPAESFSRDFVLTFEPIPFYEEYGLRLTVGGGILLILFIVAFVLLRRSRNVSGAVSAVLCCVILLCACVAPIFATEVGDTSSAGKEEYAKTFVCVHEKREYDISVKVAFEISAHNM